MIGDERTVKMTSDESRKLFRKNELSAHHLEENTGIIFRVAGFKYFITSVGILLKFYF